MATIAPSVSDNRLVWVTLADGQWQLVLRDLRSRREETLTADPHYLANPVIDGDTVVWVDADDRTGIERIRLLDLATRKKSVLSEGSLRKSEPAVNGNRVAWVERSHSEEPIALLHLHDLDTGVTEIVAKNAWAPSISDRYLAWTERIQTGEENRETDVVRVRDLRSGRIRTFVAEEGDLWYPKVSGNLLVAFTHEPRGRGGSGIILIDLQSGERREVVWSEEEIWDARIDGRTIVWIQRSDVPERDPFTPHRFEADVVIFDVDSGAMMRIKRSGEQLRPEIRDGWLAWTDWAGGRMEILAERVDRLGERL
jgi:hypothetical protein